MGFGNPPKIKFRPSFSFESTKFPRFNFPNIERIRSPLNSATVSPSATPGGGGGGPTTRNPMERVKGYFDGLKAPAGIRDEDDDVEKQSLVSVDMRDNLLLEPAANPGSKMEKVQELKKECAQVLDGIGVKGDRIWRDKRLIGGGFAILVVGTLCYALMI